MSSYDELNEIHPNSGDFYARAMVKAAEPTNEKVKIMNAFRNLVARLIKRGGQLVAEATPLKMELNHGIIGLFGEVGELGDCIKRYTMYDRAIDRTNAIEELGDIEFYLEDIRTKLGITREETLVACEMKLNKRYPEGYSNEAAEARADKAEG